MRHIRSVFALAAIGLCAMALVACDAPLHDAARADAQPALAPPAATDARAAHAADGTATSGTTLPALALSPEGLDLVDPVSGSTRHLQFGSAVAPLIDILTRVLGAAPERADNGECGAGPLDFANWKDGLSVLSQQGKFVGWSINQGEPGGTASRLATMRGIGVGATRAELDAAHAVAVMETTLGTEFVAGELYGVLDSAKADARITAMWAGTSCVFR